MQCKVGKRNSVTNMYWVLYTSDDQKEKKICKIFRGLSGLSWKPAKLLHTLKSFLLPAEMSINRSWLTDGKVKSLPTSVNVLFGVSREMCCTLLRNNMILQWSFKPPVWYIIFRGEIPCWSFSNRQNLFERACSLQLLFIFFEKKSIN